MPTDRPVILAFVAGYIPGYKAGGPIRSITELARALAGTFELRIVTADRDLGDSEQYPGITPGEWTPVREALVLYTSPEQRRMMALRRSLAATAYDVMYLNSLFATDFTLKPLVLRRLGLVRRTPVVIAPRGELSPGALQIRRMKKRIFLALAQAVGLYRGVIWHATSSDEREEIRRWFGERAVVHLARNLPQRVNTLPPRAAPKRPGHLRVVFLSRISPKKNLAGAIDMLAAVAGTGTIQADVYGPLEDAEYWATCEAKIRRLPPNITVDYRGSVRPEDVASLMREYDVFLFPTHGENHGHVIAEALAAGVPPIVSDRTPWRDLGERGAGCVAALERPQEFTAALERFLGMDDTELAVWSDAAHAYAVRVFASSDAMDSTVAMFNSATGR
ncbi:MAG TPA: glycosyltransferase [Gemmatimonadaceae bacterium]|jgi:glycosyltransferase involved in cell wall biosynthesis